MFRGLRTQLFLWTILPLIVILVVIAYVGVTGHQAAMRDMVYDRDGTLARVVAAQWSHALASHATLPRTLDPRETAQCDTACAAFDGGVAFFDTQDSLVLGRPSADLWVARQARVRRPYSPGNPQRSTLNS